MIQAVGARGARRPEADPLERSRSHTRQSGDGRFRLGTAYYPHPHLRTDEVADVTGAGDTVIATMTLALAAGASFDEAAV